jgi:release factor glutamine methyltransferase
MKTKSIKDHFKEYFEKHKQRLDLNYPGIQFSRFIEEYCEYDNSKPDDIYVMQNPGFFEKLAQGVPLEYMNFKSYFYKQEFYVNKDVLIPRSETEILCEKAIEFINSNYHDNFSIIDIGTGSGIIPLTIATEIKNKLKIIATDISNSALEVANINYDNLFSQIPITTRIEFENRDRLFGVEDKFDLIVSNPPYIKEITDRELVHPQAEMHEPHLALFLSDETYDAWFDTLFMQTANCLKESGIFMMEGHEHHLENQKKQAQKYYSSVEIVKDYTQRYRFLICKR